jgi:hypothetical protein
MARLMGLINSERGTTQALQAWIYNHGYASWLSLNRASLAFAIFYLAAFFDVVAVSGLTSLVI